MRDFYAKHQKLPNTLFLPAGYKVSMRESVAEILGMEIMFAATSKPMVGLV